MRGVSFFLIAVLACSWAVLCGSREAAGETWPLKLKRLETRGTSSQADYVYRATYPQTFDMAFGPDKGADGGARVSPFRQGEQDQAKAFKRIVKKEPQYASQHPFRAVAKLGSQEFAFALDTAPPKAEEKAPKSQSKDGKADEAKPAVRPSLLEALGSALAGGGATRPARTGKAISYSRLYFDSNGNGDLTDDKVIEAESTPEMMRSGQDYAYCQFPRVDLTIDAGGTKIDYSFTLSVTSNAIMEGWTYAYVSLNAAAYREGEITLDGKKRLVALIDFNSNGRFNDEIKLSDGFHEAGRVVYPTFGDVLVFDTDAASPVFINPYDATSSGNRHYVSKLLAIDGRYYDVKITPAGDELTLTPATPSLGYLASPVDGFSAVLYGDKGFVKLSGGKSAPVAVPEGDWKLLSYTIEQSAAPESKTPPDKEKEKAGQKQAEKPKSSSLLSALTRALANAAGPSMGMPAGAARLSLVSAQATAECKPVQVRKGQTVVLPFGPPYKPVVRVDGVMAPGLVRLGMALVGSGGEQCTNMMVGGSRPSNPQFTISDPKGQVVQQGQFEYG
jgi:hypothetical protein